jgi:dienelactone hydrolase
VRSGARKSEELTAEHPERAGIGPNQQESVAALNFLADQPQVDRGRLAVFGHSEGGIYALLLASGVAGHAPRVRAVGLLEPVPIRLLDLFERSSTASLTRLVQNGQISPPGRRTFSRPSPGRSRRYAAPPHCRPACRPR